MLAPMGSSPGVTRVTARKIARLPKATFVTRLRSSQSPSRTARQLPDPSTLIRVEPSSTRETRLQGAHREFKFPVRAKRGSFRANPKTCQKRGREGVRKDASPATGHGDVGKDARPATDYGGVGKDARFPTGHGPRRPRSSRKRLRPGPRPATGPCQVTHS